MVEEGVDCVEGVERGGVEVAAWWFLGGQMTLDRDGDGFTMGLPFQDEALEVCHSVM